MDGVFGRKSTDAVTRNSIKRGTLLHALIALTTRQWCVFVCESFFQDLGFHFSHKNTKKA